MTEEECRIAARKLCLLRGMDPDKQFGHRILGTTYEGVVFAELWDKELNRRRHEKVLRDNSSHGDKDAHRDGKG